MAFQAFKAFQACAVLLYPFCPRKCGGGGSVPLNVAAGPNSRLRPEATQGLGAWHIAWHEGAEAEQCHLCHL